MEHLRETWRRVAKSNTLYRGMELRGINADDEMIEAMRSGAFEAFVVRIVRDVVAKAGVSQWSMRMGDRGEGVGVHWSTDLAIAKSFSNTNGADRFVTAMFDSWLSLVIEATYTSGDEVANPEQNSHAYGWDGRDEKEVPLRPGAPLNLTKVYVRVPSNMSKFVADYDEDGEASTSSVKWLTIPLGFSAVASTIPATTSANGPFRTVVDVEQGDRGVYTRVRGITPRTASSGAQIEAWVDPGYELARGGFSSSASAVARIGGQAIGFLYVDCVDRTGEVVKVWVDPDHRRKGVATEMLRAVERALGFKVSHGHELSQSGAAWASGESGRTYQPTYRGEGEFSYMIGQFDRLSPSKRTGAISLREGMETQFGEYRLVYTTKDEGETKPRHLVTAYLGSERVGNLEWYGRTGEVYEIVVRADHRRKGLATAMWEFAQDAPKKPKHSTQRTNDGEAWARTTGDSMPRRSHAAVDYRTLVDALPSQYDQAIASAMENAYDMGLREEADDDGDAFWYQVYGEVMA